MRQGDRLQEKFSEYKAKICGVARNLFWRSRLYGRDDIYQEARLVLWKCLKKYPEADDDEFGRIFTRSLTNRFRDLFSVNGTKIDEMTVRLDNPSTSEIRDTVELSFVSSGPMMNRPLPWDYYEKNLEKLERSVGKETVDRLTGVSGVNRTSYIINQYKDVIESVCSR